MISNPAPSIWLVKVDELDSGRVRVKDTLSRTVFQGLSERLPRALTLLEYDVTFQLEKVAVSEDQDIMAMHSGGTLTVWHKGDDRWTDLHSSDNGKEIRFQDVICDNSKFYAVEGQGLTISLDCKTLSLAQVAGQVPSLGAGCSKYLMKLDEGFFLIVKYRLDGHPTQFIVFKLDKEAAKEFM